LWTSADRPGGLRLAAALLLTLTLWSTAATAQEGADACTQNPSCAEHSDKGRELYAAKKFDEALAEFQAAYKVEHEPLLLINQGRCYYRLGQPKLALSYYRRYLRQVPAPAPKVRDSLDRYIVEAKVDADSKPSNELINLTGGHEAIAGKPFYKTWWFWTVTGGAAAAIALGVGLGVGLGHPGQPNYLDFTWR
jgi:tetratricopeptide (TPR) repeat protein